MADDKARARSLYEKDAYVEKNPTLHEEDSPWKAEKLKPMIDAFCALAGKKRVSVLDVGGGAGLVLRGIAAYMEEMHGMEVGKYALDMSPGMLKVQAKNNPGLLGTFREDITENSVGGKAMDLCLVIDVIEHVPEQERALEEIARISRFAIFKVPLEDNLMMRLWNLATMGRRKRHWTETIGHCNAYTFSRIRGMLEEHTGEVVSSSFTNVFSYYRSSEFYRGRGRMRDRLVNAVGSALFRVSPRLCSLVVSDFALFLVRCRQDAAPRERARR